MRSLLPAVLVLLLFASCVDRFVLVEPRRHVVKEAYSFEPQVAWNKVKIGRGTLWTIDGPSLNMMIVFGGVKDGEELFDRDRVQEERRPRFASAMAATEVMEFVVASLTQVKLKEIKARDLRPVRFGSREGFQFDMTLFNHRDLEHRATALASTEGGELQLIVFTGADLHYYDHYTPLMERLFESIQIL